jgi:hypothetical protein
MAWTVPRLIPRLSAMLLWERHPSFSSRRTSMTVVGGSMAITSLAENEKDRSELALHRISMSV